MHITAYTTPHRADAHAATGVVQQSEAAGPAASPPGMPGRWAAETLNVRVFVVDDHPLARSGLAAMLQGSRGLLWVGEASTVADAVRAAPVAAPDVLLVDEDLPDMGSMQAVHMLRPYLPRCRFVLLVREADPALLRRASDAGVSSVLLKSADEHDLLKAVQAAFQGRSVPPSPASPATPPAPRHTLGADLTQRERDLLLLLARGLSNLEISAQLGIAVPTVKFHVSNVMSKLGAENRTAAVLVALRHKLVDPQGGSDRLPTRA